MQFLFGDYISLILKDHDEKRDSNQLSQRLMHLTTANIRQECLFVYMERVKNGEKEEADTLRAFFGVPPPGKNFSYLIERCNPDKFRPLQNLIRREVKNPALVNVELLAWLIGFTPRPLSNAQRLFEKKYNGIENANTAEGANESESGSTKLDSAEPNKTSHPPTVVSTQVDQKNQEVDDSSKSLTDSERMRQPFFKRLTTLATNKKAKRTTGIILLTLIFGVGIYFLKPREKVMQTPLGNSLTGCMYWADDHYEKVACNEEKKDRLLLPLNEEKLMHFRRIMLEDTITEKSIGKVHYIKRNKTIEYYTTAGNHPVEVTRSLRPLSAYMFDKYLRKQEVANKGLGEHSNLINNR